MDLELRRENILIAVFVCVFVFHLIKFMVLIWCRAGRAFDDQCDPSPFDKETADVLLKVLTARAVKKLLVQVSYIRLVWMHCFS